MKSLLSQVAALESKLDYYETEFENLNKLLKECGFERGLETLKMSANEFIVDFTEKKAKQTTKVKKSKKK